MDTLDTVDTVDSRDRPAAGNLRLGMSQSPNHQTRV
jgi:hypothetical protein